LADESATRNFTGPVPVTRMAVTTTTGHDAEPSTARPDEASVQVRRVLVAWIGADDGYHPVGRCADEGERPTMYVRKFTGWPTIPQSSIQGYSEER